MIGLGMLGFPRKRKKGAAGSSAASDHLSVRSCTIACPYRSEGARSGCPDYQAGRAVDGGPCVPDVAKVEEWRDAYASGSGQTVKRDAGRLMGSLYLHAQRMVEQIDREGLTLRAPRVDAKGNPVLVERADGLVDYLYEERAHPLLEPLARIVRLLGIDLSEFGLTTHAERAATALKGNLTLNKTDINVVLAAEQERTKEVRKILETAARLREADPVFQQFSKTGGDP